MSPPNEATPKIEWQTFERRTCGGRCQSALRSVLYHPGQHLLRKCFSCHSTFLSAYSCLCQLNASPASICRPLEACCSRGGFHHLCFIDFRCSRKPHSLCRPQKALGVASMFQCPSLVVYTFTRSLSQGYGEPLKAICSDGGGPSNHGMNRGQGKSASYEQHFAFVYEQSFAIVSLNNLLNSLDVFSDRFSSALEGVLRRGRPFELQREMRPGKLHGLRGPRTARVLGRHPFHDRVCGAVSKGGVLRDDVHTPAEHPAGVCVAEAAAGHGCFGEGLER